MANKNGVSRRSFIGAGVVAAGAVVVAPVVQTALPGGAEQVVGASTWPEALRGWPGAVEAMKAHRDALVARFRPAYLAEVRRFAEELRPRFESGELSGCRSFENDPDAEGASEVAMERLEGLCAERFGVEVRRVGYDYVGDEVTANTIIALSPSAAHWMEDDDWNHPGYCAEACLGWDVLAMAAALGFYQPAPDERPPAKATAWAREVV